jgi:P27 family predicted phage terminase small subunit
MKLLRGNPGKRKLNPDEPQVQAADPSFDAPPPELAGDTVALAEWARLAPMMRLCGLVSMSERTSLMALCQEWSQYVEAHGKVRTLGMIVKKGKHEIPMVNPYLTIADKALSNCLNLWRELGLTPSARSRMIALNVPDVSAKSRWEGLLP